MEIWMSIVGISMVSGGFPQAYRMWRRKSSADLSIPYWILLIHGLFWWLYYGIVTGSTCLIITNVTGITIDSVILAMAILYRRLK